MISSQRDTRGNNMQCCAQNLSGVKMLFCREEAFLLTGRIRGGKTKFTDRFKGLGTWGKGRRMRFSQV